MNRTITYRQLKQFACVVGIGFCVGGLFLSVPDTYKSWKFVHETYQDVFHQSYQVENVYRIEEPIPSHHHPYRVIMGQSQRKISGVVLLFMGGNLLWFFGQVLAEEFEVIERRRWKVRQSEFLLEDTRLRTGTEVQQTMEEMDMLGRLAEFQQGFRPDSVTYLPDDEEATDAMKDGGSYPETANGFFLWLLEKEIRQAKVRDISQKSFNGRHLTSERVREFVGELITQQLAEWLDEGKNEFRLLNIQKD